eukprot:TRINITY_DN8080_c0_g1_i1.p1 TRINITY_DN8080_c0_g1~~TRINITY_DN8080_c0_g1_i1.p1  ORF type:complete len:772 (+),score=131.40 TRINITY_DN8080_c0_g1_i1:328-2316(+)
MKEDTHLMISLDMKVMRENPQKLDIYLTLLELKSTKDFGKCAFNLTEKLKDANYCEEFRLQNGVQELIKKLMESTGNDLGYALQALDMYSKTLHNFQFLKIGLLEKLLDSLFSPKMNVSRRAASLLGTLSTPGINQGSNIFMRKRSLSLNWEKIISLMDHTDIQLQTAVFCFINNIISIQTDKEILIGKFQRTLQRNGILKALIKHFDKEDFEMRKQLHVFQVHHLSWLFREKNIPFNEENSEHLSLLKRLWRVGFSNEEFGGSDHSNWRLLGFQYQQPQKDLRAGGLLGLRHLIYLAETYTNVFNRRFYEFRDSLENKSAEYQLPLCTMGINITALLFRDLFPLKKITYTEDDISSLKIFPMILHPNGMLNLYCVIFEYTYCLWYRDNYTYLKFNDLMTTVKENVISVMNEHMNVITDINEFSRVLLDGLDSDIEVRTPDWDDILITGDGEELFDISLLSESSIPKAKAVQDIIQEKGKKKRKAKPSLRKTIRIIDTSFKSLKSQKSPKSASKLPTLKVPRSPTNINQTIELKTDMLSKSYNTEYITSEFVESTAPLGKSHNPSISDANSNGNPDNPIGLTIGTNLDNKEFVVEPMEDGVISITTVNPSSQFMSLVSATNTRTQTPMILEPTGTQTATGYKQHLTLDYTLIPSDDDEAQSF